MSQDYTKSRAAPGSSGEWFPNAQKDSAWGRLVPLLGPQELRTFLFVPLVSAVKDQHGKRREMSDSDLADVIRESVGLIETQLSMTIFDVQYQERHPFDRFDYQSYGYLRLRQKPVASVERLAVVQNSGDAIYVVPNEWISVGNLHKGQINILPSTVALASNAENAAVNGALSFIMIMMQQGWVPDFWEVTYTAGFRDGLLPDALNLLIKYVAGIEVLSRLAATYAGVNSASLSIDGLSQSSSGPGPQLYETRIKQMSDQRDKLFRRFKAMIGNRMMVGQI